MLHAHDGRAAWNVVKLSGRPRGARACPGRPRTPDTLGTYIAIRDEVPLASGDFVRIGQHLFRVDFGSLAPRELPPGAPADGG